MKKIRSLVAFLLSITLIAPLATLQACEENELELSPEDQLEVQLPETPNGEVETPESPETPETEESTGNTNGGESDTGGNTTVTPAPTPTPTVEYAQYIKCTGESVNIRSGAGSSYTVLGSAEKGTSYAVVGKSGNWYKTYYKNQTAYIYASYAAVFTIEESGDDEVESVLAEGYKLIGVPYVYGAVRFHDGNGKLLAGFTAQKFDCSSLVQYVFYKGAGKILDVNTRTQVKQGKYVAPSDIQRGDCLFFTNESRQYLTGIERVGHVAIYLGNNYILHTASDYARIEQISAARWNFFIEARRFF